MRNLARFVLSSGAAVLFSGCGGSQFPIGTNAAPQSGAIATHANRGGSWMLPEAKSQNLLYVSSYYKYVNAYSYPKGKLVGTLTGFGTLAGDCSDKRGDVWIIDNQNGKLYEYAHGGTTPIASLTPTSGDALSCAVNPRSGDLAVGTGTEVLLIYNHAKGTPTDYRDYGVEGFLYCAYDPKGNLYIAAVTPTYQFQFAELAAGAASIANIELDQSIERPGGVAAMRNEVAVGDGETGIVYGFQISGSSGTKVGTTPLDGAYDGLGPFLVRGKHIVAAVESQDAPAIDTFDWPAGGAPTKSITKDLEEPLGVALSVAPRR